MKFIKMTEHAECMDFKVVLEGYRRCPDNHDLSECHHLQLSFTGWQ